MAATEEALLKRVLPHSIEAEQSVIGSMIMDREAITVASEIISGDDFYNRQYGAVFDTMVELNDEGRPVDLVTLQDRLREKDVPPEVSSLEFIRDLITAVPTSANIKYYAGIVAEKSTLRKLIRLNEEIANTCYVGKENLEVILEDTEKRVFELVQKRNTGEFVPIRQVVMNAMDKIEKASKSNGNVTGIATGFIDLDYRTAGMQPSDLILVAARPSMGKTAFVLNIAQYVAFKLNQTVAIFSLEMSKEQLVNRLFSLESKVDSQHLRTGNLSDAEWEKLIESAGVIGKSNLIIDDTPGISISELRSKCRKYKLEHDLKIIIIDYLQLMSGSGRGSDSRQQEISDISRSLKALARELNVPVVALSQLSRAVEQRPDHRPMLSDLRESGAIEQDADVVMFIY
ncbi:MAG: replicative DNA helicase, partial [Lachnospiraceae bacterium]|nr:replicative DNA helicase [Lachnospiraceae bacterium]